MIDGVDVTSTFRLGPIHDAQAYICCVSLVRQRLHLDDNAARVIGEDIWQRAHRLQRRGKSKLHLFSQLLSEFGREEKEIEYCNTWVK